MWRRLWQRVEEDELLTRAAALSFYFIFALFPMALSLLAVLGMFAQSRTLHVELANQLGRLMPPSARSLVEATLGELKVHSSGWKIAVGLAVALWSGSGGMMCIMDALDRSRRSGTTRPWWRRQIIALGLTAVISGLSVIALLIVLVGGKLSGFIGELTGLSRATVLFWKIAEWPVALSFLLVSLDLVYWLGPAARPKWKWFTPGSIIGVIVWVAASLLFRLYVHDFGSYGRTYGSLGAVMVLLFWLYIAGLAILAGGEINAEIDERDGLD